MSRTTPDGVEIKAASDPLLGEGKGGSSTTEPVGALTERIPPKTLCRRKKMRLPENSNLRFGFFLRALCAQSAEKTQLLIMLQSRRSCLFSKASSFSLMSSPPPYPVSFPFDPITR